MNNETIKTQEDLERYEKAVDLDRIVQFNALINLLFKKKIISKKDFDLEIKKEHKKFIKYLKENNDKIKKIIKDVNKSKSSYIG